MCQLFRMLYLLDCWIYKKSRIRCHLLSICSYNCIVAVAEHTQKVKELKDLLLEKDASIEFMKDQCSDVEKGVKKDLSLKPDVKKWKKWIEKWKHQF